MFEKDFSFMQYTSSLYLRQGNGKTERRVQTFKNLLQKFDDPYC